MANTCRRIGSGGSLSRRYSDEGAWEKFRVTLDTATSSIVTACNSARAANPTQFPLRGQAWPEHPTYGLYADSFDADIISETAAIWEITVRYAPLQPNESDTEGSNDNPLLWPAVFGLEWIEREVAITEARNVEAFTGVNHSRSALTLGPVVNSALQEFDEGIFDSIREAVLVITRNVPSINDVLAIERDYGLTCNSDTVFGIGPRRYKYLGVETPGRQVANGIVYFPRVIRVAILKTTDKVVNNVGWHNLDFGGNIVKYKVRDVDDNGSAIEPPVYVDPAEPGFLTMAGGRSTTATKVTYRYLTEVPYAGLLS